MHTMAAEGMHFWSAYAEPSCTQGHGGLPGMDFYNVMRDPGEKYGELYPGLVAVTPIQILLQEHMKMAVDIGNQIGQDFPTIRGHQKTDQHEQIIGIMVAILFSDDP